MAICFPEEYTYRQQKLKTPTGIITLSKEAEEAATIWNKLRPELKADHIVVNNFDKYFYPLAKCSISSIRDVEMLEVPKKPKNTDTSPKIMIEPPCIFIGRGAHPLRGMFKQRIKPEDITINWTSKEKIPDYKWGTVLHDSKITWLLCWLDPVSQKRKYVYPLNRDYSKSEIEKFALAQKLKRNLLFFRRTNNFNLQTKDIKRAQLVVSSYLIDLLCIRAGNEKDSDSSDTVGCCTLQVKNITFLDPQINKIRLNFLGKDSIEFDKQFSVDKPVWTHLQNFVKHKKPEDDIFDQIDTQQLNTYISSIVPDVTAKVFRTCHGSSIFQKKLKAQTCKTPKEQYVWANTAAAELCNHKKTSSEEQIVLSLTTSRTNYLDPRITVAYCKRSGLPISSVFSPALMKKHEWAMETNQEFKF